MANRRISTLPTKTGLIATDILLVVDTQFGPSNYIDKKTTVGDLLSFAEVAITNQIEALNPVISVNGLGGIVVLVLNQLDDVNITAVQNGDVLVYDSTQNKWINKAIDFIDFVLDCGNF
jgi:hypothetical protein